MPETRRAAYYTNILRGLTAPRDRVQQRRLLNEGGASSRSIWPHVYQTRTFLALAAAAMASRRSASISSA
jgi:hypothetical protein